MNRCSLRVTPKEQEGRAEEHSLFCRICWKNTFDLLTNPRFCAMIRNGLRDRSIWAHSSAGRAPRSQCGGQGFDPPWVHQSPNRESEGKSRYNGSGLFLFIAAAIRLCREAGKRRRSGKQTISTFHSVPVFSAQLLQEQEKLLVGNFPSLLRLF